MGQDQRPPQGGQVNVQVAVEPLVDWRVIRIPPADATEETIRAFEKELNALSRDRRSARMVTLERQGLILAGKIESYVQLTPDVKVIGIPAHLKI